MNGISGSIIIPAHNEAAVILRTLQPLAELAAQGVEVIVSTNGCTDATASLASQVPGVLVLETSETSKVAALNAADCLASHFPRMYLDADIEISASSVIEVLLFLDRSGKLAARPPYLYATGKADPLVRAYYRARDRLPGVSGRLWGAGVYAVNRDGHQRISPFPDIIADDLFVDSQFDAHEIAILMCDPVTVQVPRSWRSLLSTLRRINRGNTELRKRAEWSGTADTTYHTLKQLLLTVRTPASLLDALIYSGFAVTSRAFARTSRHSWIRDQTSRTR